MLIVDLKVSAAVMLPSMASHASAAFALHVEQDRHGHMISTRKAERDALQACSRNRSCGSMVERWLVEILTSTWWWTSADSRGMITIWWCQRSVVSAYAPSRLWLDCLWGRSPILTSNLHLLTLGVFRSQNPPNPNFSSHQNHIETLNITNDSCMEY